MKPKRVDLYHVLVSLSCIFLASINILEIIMSFL